MKPKVKWLFLISIILVGIIFLSWSMKLIGKSSTGLTTYNLDECYYLSYNFKSQGIMNPKIKDIVLLDDNYKPITYDNNAFSYDFYIDENKHTGVLTEESALSEEIKMGYKEIKGYKIREKDFQVVLVINFHKKLETNFQPYIKITYDNFGIKRSLEQKVTVISSVQTN
ncbi:hypothetical protein LGK97_17020 [Clostridium sp. CS001]|uniref:hypothetical protein n=1 Tax=Clostridium sp. CS001 TaxID=2880648 RepID=UPI001CF0E161|nr:hypothetical protein [Clostridium sp. CS001]MCB2291430.1 hypothetical protein [Clostridium sp. CS001]